MYEVREVLRFWLDGEGLRSIERLSQVDSATVRRYVTAAEELGLIRYGDGGGDQLGDAFVAAVVAAVRRTVGRTVGPNGPFSLDPPTVSLRQCPQTIMRTPWTHA